MKATEIRDLNADEIQQKVADLKEALFNLRFQHEIGQLENPKKIGETKKTLPG
jgi:large subunit ribosomal protein L29